MWGRSPAPCSAWPVGVKVTNRKDTVPRGSTVMWGKGKPRVRACSNTHPAWDPGIKVLPYQWERNTGRLIKAPPIRAAVCEHTFITVQTPKGLHMDKGIVGWTLPDFAVFHSSHQYSLLPLCWQELSRDLGDGNLKTQLYILFRDICPQKFHCQSHRPVVTCDYNPNRGPENDLQSIWSPQTLGINDTVHTCGRQSPTKSWFHSP